ncbi:hypothetical protein [Thermoactinospora rubra]|uniref:hypothetical protein n=1 Tax=Thermoactinospora rubra TaxID=1088767 RepID=UPI000A0F76ED|nr:hypothetical protein [Thermoactinospora rubra]
MARWFGLWWGGSGYSRPESNDLEEFASLVEARRKLVERYLHGYWQTTEFRFVHREPTRVLTPCVDTQCEILLFRSSNAEVLPELRLSIGPRGGVRLERC